MPHKRAEAALALDELRSRAWAWTVRRAYAREARANPHVSFITLERELERERGEVLRALDKGTRYLYRYERGGRKPDDEQLALYETEFPGTREVFECGPDGSYLWEAIRCRDNEAAQALSDKMCHDIRSGIR